jgi:hypothetical protein
MQGLEVTTHRRLRQLQCSGEFSDREFFAFKKSQHARALRIGERAEDWEE